MRKKVGIGPKKELNADLNLTPFIDLLSTCVCFLLITAVWIEIGSVEIKKISYDLDLVYFNPTKISLNLKKNGKKIRTYKVSTDSEDKFQNSLSSTIAQKILKIKKGSIDIASATITPRSSVNYGHLMKTLDTLRSHNIINIGVLTAKER